MSCCAEKPTSKPADQGGRLRLFHLAGTLLPEGSALLSCSCCWLPTVLDFLFAGSMAAGSVEKMRNAFLAISILTLVWGLWREGLSRRMIWRVSICGGLLAWAQFGEKTHHSCH